MRHIARGLLVAAGLAAAWPLFLIQIDGIREEAALVCEATRLTDRPFRITAQAPDGWPTLCRELAHRQSSFLEHPDIDMLRSTCSKLSTFKPWP